MERLRIEVSNHDFLSDKNKLFTFNNEIRKYNHAILTFGTISAILITQ